ncbi:MULTISPECIES: spermidine N1-acetyltransferase [Vibrio]|uniref:Spermidine N1-acetyltransferase n=1 Tax=Vibrio algicola TaxID=2662262 RepID=A0A5Q0TJP2_9VIBR|nr:MULTISPECIES: spermidine N1-acetyltransferase [Vibrio]MBD1577196.1 spermidine N1-acetyltransferase [Vibrio sp. S11_S32]
MSDSIRIRALEKDDLRFIHSLNNNRSVMSYWFEEPYESFMELESLYVKHIHDLNERRFIAENGDREHVGLVELVEINYIHRTAEFQIIIAPYFQGRGYAREIIDRAVNYAFKILNVNKLYLQVSDENEKAVYLYESFGFKQEGLLIEEFFMNGQYRNAIRMYMLQRDYLNRQDQPSAINAVK